MSGIPFEQPQLRAITTPVFNVEPDGPYRMTSPEQTLYYTLFQSKIPSLYEMLALMRQLCLFTPKKKYWFKNPVCINLFKGAKKLFHAFYGICLDDRDVLVPMRKNGRPIPVALEDCPAFILADVLYAVLHTDPLLRYAERNRFAAVHYDDDGWVIDDGLRQKNIDSFIKDAFQILFLDLNCSKGHPELDLLVAKDLTYESWYPYIRHLADAEEIIIQDGVVLTGFLNDGCPALLYHGLRGYLPYFNAAMAGFIVMLLKGPLKYTLYGNAKYYSIRPEEFVNKKIQEVTTPLNGTMATHWTNYIRLDGAGILPPDSNVADPLKGKGFLDTVREQLLGLEYYFKVTWIDIDCLYLHFIRAFIDQYGVNGRIYVNELSLEDDDVSFALRFRKAHDLGSPGLAVAICKYDTDKDSLPRIEIEFERPIVYNDGTLGRFIFTAGEIRHRVEHIYKLLLKILDNPDKYSIADGVIHPIKVE